MIMRRRMGEDGRVGGWGLTLNSCSDEVAGVFPG